MWALLRIFQPSQSRLWHFLSCVTPSVGIYFINFIALGRQSFDDVMNGSVFYAEGLGLFWNVSDWWPIGHLASYFSGAPIIQASAIYYWFTGLTRTAIGEFWVFTLLIPLLFLIIICLWTSILSAYLQLPTVLTSVAASQVITNPVIIAMPRHAYSFYGMLLLPYTCL